MAALKNEVYNSRYLDTTDKWIARGGGHGVRSLPLVTVTSRDNWPLVMFEIEHRSILLGVSVFLMII